MRVNQPLVIKNCLKIDMSGIVRIPKTCALICISIQNSPWFMIHHPTLYLRQATVFIIITQSSTGQSNKILQMTCTTWSRCINIIFQCATTTGSHCNCIFQLFYYRCHLTFNWAHFVEKQNMTFVFLRICAHGKVTRKLGHYFSAQIFKLTTCW